MTHSLTVLLCGVKTEQIVQEREYEEQFIFPGLDCILALAAPDIRTVVSSITKERCVIKEVCNGSYAGLHEENFLNIRVQ